MKLKKDFDVLEEEEIDDVCRPEKVDSTTCDSSATISQTSTWKWGDVVWRNVAAFLFLHPAAIYGLYLTLIGAPKWQTFVWFYVIMLLGGLGITAGAHRLWCHRSYKAKWPLRSVLKNRKL